MTAASQSSRHRWIPRVRVSLRLFLLGFTAVCIAIPVWYRWPYRDEEIHYYLQPNGEPDKTRVHARIVTTWQRQWGGGRKRHGRQTCWRRTLNVSIVENYVNDQRHGPYHLTCDLWETFGEYRSGQKHGEWRTIEGGKVTRLESFKDGVPHGRYSGVSEINGCTYSYLLADGHLDWSDPSSQAHPLFRKALAGEIDDESVLKALRENSPNDAPIPIRWDSSLEMPVADLSAMHRVPIVLGSTIPLPTQPQVVGTFQTDLAAQLLQLAQLHGVVLDYRDGKIWITSATETAPSHAADSRKALRSGND